MSWRIAASSGCAFAGLLKRYFQHLPPKGWRIAAAAGRFRWAGVLPLPAAAHSLSC
jgi:hypothetical protein